MRRFLRRITAIDQPAPATPAPGPRRALDVSADALREADAGGYVPPFGMLPFNPLSLIAAPDLAAKPTLNLLLPRIAMVSMSGGPNTAINIACRLAARGLAVRLISADDSIDPDPAPFWAHARALAGLDGPLPDIQLVDATDRGTPLAIGANDVFLATAWQTAQLAKYALRHTRVQRFVYLIQDYEPLIHPASTPMALAEETYGLDYVPLINTGLLHEFFTSRGIGRFADPAFAAAAAIFEPAVDRTHFFREPGARSGRRRLLFYARPFSAARNLFELGVAALQKLVLERRIDPEAWEFVAMGDAFEAVALGRGAVLRCAPWLNLDGYARQMRESEVLLSLMMSPHPSYPPLEMAACGGTVVTTTHANKTAARLAGISPSIIGVPATVEAVCDGLARAVQASTGGDGLARAAPDIGLPRHWSESFADILPRLHDSIVGLQRP